MEVIAVFDIGKTNKKLLLFNKQFEVVYQVEEKFTCTNDEDGFECDDIDLITTWISKKLAEVISAEGCDLKAVNFSTYGASLAFLDNEGKRLTPIYNYLKEVPANIAEELFLQYGGKDEFCRKTASPALGLLLNSGVQMLWLKKERPELFARTKSILHFPQYLSYSLTKEIVSEPTSIGCHTFLWDFDQMKYHKWVKDNELALPDPVTNDRVTEVSMFNQKFQVGTGIHDSSASLVPYLKGSSEEFILVSTGTWCINMNPFNTEPLTADQLAQDCLCFLTPDKKQVKSSRLFMGHFHEVWGEKLASHFGLPADSFKSVVKDEALIEKLNLEFGGESVFFSKGKDGFEEGIQHVDLGRFESYRQAYTKLMIDLTALCVDSIQLIIPENDKTKTLFVSGGFARNPIFIHLLESYFPEKKIKVSDIDNSSALGAAMIIADSFGLEEDLKPNLEM